MLKKVESAFSATEDQNGRLRLHCCSSITSWLHNNYDVIIMQFKFLQPIILLIKIAPIILKEIPE